VDVAHGASRRGNERVERVVTAAVDEKFRPIPGTERSFDVDTVLIAVGLSPVDELLQKAREYGMNVYAAGDSEEIAEASAAIFSGKITGRHIARDIGMDVPSRPIGNISERYSSTNPQLLNRSLPVISRHRSTR